MGQLEPTQAALGGARERAPLVAEHLRLHQVARDGGAVHGDEGPPGPAARRVHRGRRQLLARPALAREQHARLGGADPRDELADLLHGRALAHQRGAASQLGVKRPVLRPGETQLQRGPHRDQHRLGCERLLEKLKGPELDRPHRVGQLRLPAHHDDRHGSGALPNAGQGLEPVRARRHEQVQQHHVGIHGVELQQRRASVGRLGHREPFLPQQCRQHPADVGLVVHQENLRPRRHRPCIRITKVAPPPGVGSTAMVPRCISTVCFASASPRPVPPLLAVTYGSKSRPVSSGGTPGP